MSDAIQPLGRVFVTIKCSNPSCMKQFSVELDEKGEKLTSCPKCGKGYYVRGSTPVWVRSIAPK